MASTSAIDCIFLAVALAVAGLLKIFNDINVGWRGHLNEFEDSNLTNRTS